MTDNLKQRQAAGEEVERQMIEFLIQFDPARDMKVSDVKTIANYARGLAFNYFSAVEGK